MASSKKYSYYLRGNQLALIEEDTGLGSGTCSLSNYKNQSACENAGGTWTKASTSGADMGQYKSPQESITDGLEIEYAYSPRYSLGGGVGAQSSTNVLGDTKVVVGSWFIDVSGYLNFNTHAYALQGDRISASSTPYDNFVVDTYLLVRKSKNWNGLHKVKTLYSNGYIQTYTQPAARYDTGVIGTGSAITSHSDGYVSGSDTNEVWVNLSLSTGDFVNIYDMSDSNDNGLYKVTSITETDGGAESTQKAYIGTKYFLNQEDDIDEWQTGDSHLATDASISVTKVRYDPCYLYANVNVLNDESDTIDLPEYLTKALVYYVKSQVAEDRGDMEMFAYNRKQFRALMQRYESSRTWGSRRVFPGIGAIR